MNKKELAKMYVDYLSKEGFHPELDKDGDVVFKSEGKTYLIIADENDPVYFRLIFPNFWAIESEPERQKVLVAADYATGRTKVAKVYTTQNNNVWASIEVFLRKPEDFKEIFQRSMSALQASVANFVEKMR